MRSKTSGMAHQSSEPKHLQVYCHSSSSYLSIFLQAKGKERTGAEAAEEMAVKFMVTNEEKFLHGNFQMPLLKTHQEEISYVSGPESKKEKKVNII